MSLHGVERMYKNELSKVSKENLVELCNDLLTESWDNGRLSNHYILTMLKELAKEN